MASYLWLRGQTWFFQLRPPHDLHHLLGMTPFRIRLPVHTHREASRIARHLAGSAERRFAVMRYIDGGMAVLKLSQYDDLPNLTPEERQSLEASLRRPFIEALTAEVQEICRTAEQFDTYEKIKRTASRDDKEAIASKQKELFDKVHSSWQRFATSVVEDYGAVFKDMQRYSASLSQTVDELNYLNEGHQEDFRTWKAKLAKIAQEAKQLETEKHAAHEENTKTLAGMQALLKNTTEITDRILYEGPLLSECKHEFLEAKKKQLPGDSTEPTYFERRIDAFLSLIGDKPIAAYRVADLGDFAAELKLLPKRHTVDPEWVGKTLKQAIQDNRSLPADVRAETISYKTVKINYVGKIKTAIRWLCANHKVKYPFEYDLALVPKDLPSPTVRHGLDDNQLNALFRECVRAVEKKRPEDVWLPLLAYLTGARLGELVGLQPHNIRRYHGVYVADLTTRIHDEAGVRNRPIKNRDSLRIFALHHKLEDVGFIEWVERQREAGHHFLFPDLHEAVRPNHAASKRFQRMFSGLKLGGSYVFHSLRHSFKDWTRRMEVPERTIALQAGHSLDGIALQYGSKILRSDELQLIAKLPLVPEVDFDVFKGVMRRLRPRVAVRRSHRARMADLPVVERGRSKSEDKPARLRKAETTPCIDVRALRAEMGLSQRQFAERFGFSCGALRDWEQGRTSPGRTARAQLAAIAAKDRNFSPGPQSQSGPA